jgi:hypothetical protein
MHAHIHEQSTEDTMSERAPQQPEKAPDESLSDEALESVSGGRPKWPSEDYPPVTIDPIDPIILEPLPYIETDTGTV